MKNIGGSFSRIPLPDTCNHFLEDLTPPGGQLLHTMSGRCGIYAALLDHKKTDSRMIAYVPAYTCETVLAPYVKAGYSLVFYDIDRNMRPVFDSAVLERISVLALCGYYGFSGYDRSFVSECSRKGICILLDATHSIFSADGIDPHCDYAAGSFRKWLGVPCGGFVIKRKGAFGISLLPPEEQHVKWRKEWMDSSSEEKDTLFWKSEMTLRQTFDAFASDPESIDIIRRYPTDRLCSRRRNNYRYLLEHLTPSDMWEPVFPVLPEGVVPSHFTLYARDREALRLTLQRAGIRSTVYWPVGPFTDLSACPGARYIYDHVCSLPCDQRYEEEEMQEICRVLNVFVS